MEIKENASANSAQIKTLGFTGDLGREESPILRSPEYITEETQTLITECTYGGSSHKPFSEAAYSFKNIINSAIKNKGKIIIPAFSLGRTQEIIYILHKLLDKKIIPPLPIFIDSPLAEDITEIFPKYINDFDDDFWKDFGKKGESPFSIKNLIYIRPAEESKALNKKTGPLIIISASGMAEGGRVLHHLKNNIENPQNIILLTGYQAENTLGRKIQEGISPVKIYGKDYSVRAKIITLNEFSAHADQNGLFSYISRIKNLEKIFLVHTEIPQAEEFKNILKKSYSNLSIEIPAMNSSFEL